MRSKLVFLPIFAFIVAFFVLYTTINQQEQQVSDNLGKEVLGDSDFNFIDVKVDDDTYRAIWFFTDIDQLRLLPNLDSRLITQDIVDSNHCINAANGGFYDIDNSYLGLLISEGIELSAYESNSFLNGILSVNRLSTPRITRIVPEDPLVTAVQTGPILVENAQVVELQLARDKNARRTVAITTGNNELVFVGFFDPDSQLFGPTLEQLPRLVDKWADSVNLSLADAINLDGGSASAIYVEGKSIKEASPVGSLFCVTSDLEE